MRIALSADHRGYTGIKQLQEKLQREGHEAVIMGDVSGPPADYPDRAFQVGKAVAEGKADLGVLLCGTGIGMSIAANKVPGALAANVENAYAARQGVEHDAMNVLVMGARTLGIEVARDLMHAFLGAQFVEDERFIRRLNKVRQIETDYQKN